VPNDEGRKTKTTIRPSSFILGLIKAQFTSLLDSDESGITPIVSQLAGKTKPSQS